MSGIVGIDLGTTFSAVSALDQGKPVILPDGAERLIPSVVGFTPAGGLLVGTPARNQYLLNPENTVRSIKRRMGTFETVVLNGRPCTPAEVSALILKEMKRIAERALGGPVDRAVITVPAFFSDAARQATQEAGELAGFKVERIINEPTAAALAYGLDRAGERLRVAVYDLGGGTFDVSIIELDQGVIEVRASHGDTHLGGDDFDALVGERILAGFLDRHGRHADPGADPRAMARLSRAAEAAKIALSTQPYARVREEYLVDRKGRPLHLDTEVSRVEFEDLIRPPLERSLDCFDRALTDAGLTAEDLDRVILVGGSTRIPLVWEMVARHTGLEPMMEINPDEAVALGAGVQAAIIAGEPIDAVLVDVTPHSLGIEVARWAFGDLAPDHYSVIIHRNTALPVTRAMPFSAVFPDQTGIELKIYQGEQPIASANTLLGEFHFEGLKPEQKGTPPTITVEFDMDVSGFIHVSATDRGSRKVKQATVHAAHTRLSPSDRAASARFLESAWAGVDEDEDLPGDFDTLVEPRAEDAPILARARIYLEDHHEACDPLADLIRRTDRARAEGRMEAAKELQELMLKFLYEVEDSVAGPEEE
jgi:molecular chaperone DnaK